MIADARKKSGFVGVVKAMPVVAHDVWVNPPNIRERLQRLRPKQTNKK
jgi:hypothetical protein